MNRTLFGQLVASLRYEQFDPLEGRVWSQQKLAECTGLTKKIVGDIERGSRVNLDADTLRRLADAFGLGPAERRQFFSLAAEVDEDGNGMESVGEAIDRLVRILNYLQSPAFIHDDLFNIIAYNDLWNVVLTGGALEPPNGYGNGPPSAANNYLRLLFDPDAALRHAAGVRWDRLAQTAILRFRLLGMRYRHSDYYRILFAELMHCPDFSRIWLLTRHLSEEFVEPVRPLVYRHPTLGRLSYINLYTSYYVGKGRVHLTLAVSTDATTGNTWASWQQAHTNGIKRLNVHPLWA